MFTPDAELIAAAKFNPNAESFEIDTCKTFTSIVTNCDKRLFCFAIYSPTRFNTDGGAVTVIVPKLRETVKFELSDFPIIADSAFSTSSHSFSVDSSDT